MTREKLTNDLVLGIKHYEDLFNKRKRKFPISYFYFPIKTRKKTIPLPKGLFKKTIAKYLDIYFGELYYNDTPKYFFLSGLIKKVKGSQFFVNTKRNITHTGRSITLLWYQRPQLSYFANVRMIKMNGSSNKILVLDNNYKASKDVELLPSAKDEMKRVTLFKT